MRQLLSRSVWKSALLLLTASFALALFASCSSSPNAPSSVSVESKSSAMAESEPSAATEDKSGEGGASLKLTLSSAAPSAQSSPSASRKAASEDVLYYTKEISRNSSSSQNDCMVISTTGKEVKMPYNYQVIGPCSEDLFMVRWLDPGEDSWGVGTDGVFKYGFMDTKGMLQISLEEVAQSAGLPMTDDNGAALQCDSGAYFQENHAVLTCRYGKPHSQLYQFNLVIDKSGKTVAWAGVYDHYIDAPAASSMSYLSFYDAMSMDNFPSYSVARAYENGFLRVGRGNSLVSNGTILVDYEGSAYANFHAEDIPVVRKSNSMNAKCVLGGDMSVYSYSPGNDAAHADLLLDANSFNESQEFTSSQFVDVVGDDFVIAVNAEKSTAKGNRTKAGLFDASSGQWVSEPILGGAVGDVYGGACVIKVSGGYNEEYGDGAGLMAVDGSWLFAPNRLVDGKTVSSISHYADSFWLIRVKASGSNSADYLFDAGAPELDPVKTDGLVSISKDVYVGAARDEALIEAASK